MISTKDLFAHATEMHRAGRIDVALTSFMKIVAREPANPEALYWIGCIHNQRAEYDRAVEVLKRAIVERPGVPSFHVALAESCRNLGGLKRAAGCCRTALKLKPDYPEALCTLGLVLQALGRPGEAADQFRRALELRPDFAQAHRDLAMVLRELGHRDQAIEHLRCAVDLAPRYAAARSGLCLMLLDCGEPDEALIHGQEAVRLQPDLAVHHHNLGNVLERLDRPDEARGAFLEALRLDPELAHSHLQVGMNLRARGQLVEAEPWFKQALEINPENAWFWEQLADLELERQEHAAAIPCWERAIELSAKERAGPYISLGWSLHEEGRLTEAFERYRTALRLQPEAVMAHINMGGIYEELGDMAAAEAAYRAAVAIQPNFGLAYARLATLLRGRLPAPDRAAMEERLADPETNPSARTRLLFALGLVLDADGEYGRAALCARQANALNMERERRARGYTPPLHVQYVDGVINGFTPAFFERAAGGGSDDIRLVFVFGLPRSGTTLVEQILASHSRVLGAGELKLVRQSFDAIPTVLESPGSAIEGIKELDAIAVERLAAQHLARLERLVENRPAARIVDKMPDNYIYLGLIAAMFPRAVFIHCRRDLRDVALSTWLTDFRPENIPWASEPTYIGSRFEQYLRLLDHWRSVMPAKIHEVNYEETVADLEGAARRLTEACGLEFEPRCLDFHRTERRVKTASLGQVRQPIYTHSVGRWRNYVPELDDLFRAIPAAAPCTESASNGQIDQGSVISRSGSAPEHRMPDEVLPRDFSQGRRTKAPQSLETHEV